MNHIFPFALSLLIASGPAFSLNAQVISPEQATYEVSNYLSLTGRYEAAVTGYEALLRNMPRSDIYHNAGINKALCAQNLLSETDRRYVFPFEWGSATQDLRTDEVRKERLLLEAKTLLEQSIRMEVNARVYVDYAAVLARLRKYEQARHFARQARSYLGTSQTPQRLKGFSLAIEAICTAELGEHNLSQVLISQAVELKEPVVEALLIANDLIQYRSQPAYNKYFGVERIEGKTPTEFIQQEQAFLPYASVSLPDDGPKILFYSRHHSHVYSYQMPWKTAYFLFTNPTYRSPSSGGIHVGDTEAQLTRQYGPPRAIRRNQSGEIWYYDENGIIFRLGEKGHVEGWVTFFSH